MRDHRPPGTAGPARPTTIAFFPLRVPLLGLLGVVLALGFAPVAARAQDNEPRVERRVAEDDQNRIEELRVRGETQRITVKPKAAIGREYEIQPRKGGADPSQKGARAGGDRVWRLLSF